MITSIRHSTKLSNHTTNHRQYSTATNRGLKLILLGVPGAGKGTQSEKIQRDFKTTAISTGHLLRTHISDKTAIGQIAEKQMQNGGLVDDKLIIDIMKGALSEQKMRQTGWLLDGFPRTLPQATQLTDLLKSLGEKLDMVLFLDINEQVVFDRLQERLVHPSSGRTYNLSYNPPKIPGKDDVTGEPLIRRSDDTLETIRARIEAYHKATTPLLDYYKKAGLLRTINSPTSDVGYVQIKKLLDEATSK
eukprot:TRINITY_DN1106_c0_g1_i1.p1 TRINITY_DN1106_c0_g1~~TRINITY_DN1106_c0_g1_i1.p1  ORF type:complete len:247 (-),score=49.46 TRINITY_DN1106_c0_g1_i1:108-848(-)